MAIFVQVDFPAGELWTITPIQLLLVRFEALTVTNEICMASYKKSLHLLINLLLMIYFAIMFRGHCQMVEMLLSYQHKNCKYFLSMSNLKLENIESQGA